MTLHAIDNVIVAFCQRHNVTFRWMMLLSCLHWQRNADGDKFRTEKLILVFIKILPLLKLLAVAFMYFSHLVDH